MADEGRRNGLPSEGLHSGIPTQVLKKRYYQASPSPPKWKNGSEDLNDTATSISPAGSSTSSSSRELRSEEAELAAVIAKVTGRASPFVNEFDGGKRKFTILCGDAANAGELLPEGTTSFTTKDTLENKDFISCVNSKIPSENYAKPRIVGVEMKKTFGDGSRVPVEHDGSKIAKDFPDKVKRTKTSEVEDVAHGVSNNSNDETLPGEGESTLNHSKTVPKEIAVNGKHAESTDQIPQGNDMVPTDVADTLNTGNKDHKIRKVEEDQVNIENSISEVDSERVHDSKIEYSKDPDSMNPEESAPEKGKDCPTKVVSNLDTGKVKACFPPTRSTVTVKSFDMNEIEQNLINRRMAARNATAIAEFDPLVTVSPEAKKLAMWSTVNPTRKFVDGLDECDVYSSTDSGVRSTEDHLKNLDDELFKNVQDNLKEKHLIKSTKDPFGDNEGFVKGTDKQTDFKTTSDKLPSEDALMIKSLSGKDGGELGDDGSAKRCSFFRNNRWMVSGLLLIVISIFIFVPLMVFSFNQHTFYYSGSDITDGVLRVEQYESSIGHPEGLIDIFQEDSFMQDENLNTAELESIFEVLPDEEDLAEEDFLHETDFSSSTGRFKGNEVRNPFSTGDSYIKANSKPTRQSVCNSLDLKAVAACGKIKPLLLKLLFKSVLLCQESEDILIPGYIQMYRYLNSFLSSFGGFAAVQTRMLEERVNQLESYTLGDYKPNYHTVFKMVYFEVSAGSINNTDPFSATILFTCLHRHLQYLALTLEYILTIHPDQSLQLAFETAYEKTLAKHHTWLVKSIYDVGMNMLPTKNQATLLLSIRQVEKVAIPELEESLGLLISELTTLNNLAETILNLTDVFSVIPGQAIT